MKQDEKLRMTDDSVCETLSATYARQHLVHAFVRLLNASPDDGLHWIGTKTDFFEIAYIVFDDGSAYNELGQRPSFSELVTRACAVFHVDRPANPRAYVNRAHVRKGTFLRTLLERYRLMLTTGMNVDPLSRFICCRKSHRKTGCK